MLADSSEKLFGLFWEIGILILCIAVAWAARRSRRNLSRRAQSWPGVQGHIESVTHETDIRRGSLLRPQIVDVTYSYVALGERYVGRDALSFRREDQAEECIRILKGLDIPVRYNPGSPAESSPDYPPAIPK